MFKDGRTDGQMAVRRTKRVSLKLKWFSTCGAKNRITCMCQMYLVELARYRMICLVLEIKDTTESIASASYLDLLCRLREREYISYIHLLQT